ncbi:hypothetical protein H5410_002809 [Solanum commersonii]|uniref:Uncharacterized protein n=1 Tax=Solanum commersonii TaxID=4109 RepID=A0A9J6B378_SOLCO|nr:hypothetical protein H5410_002809 [Solanum commersonii]
MKLLGKLVLIAKCNGTVMKNAECKIPQTRDMENFVMCMVFKKGKARVLSSGRVLPIEVKNKFDARTQNEEEKDKEGKLHARNEQDISSNKKTNKDARIFRQGESSKDWVIRSFGKKIDITVLDKHAQQRTTNIH